jgi:flagellar protein FlgJ
MPGLNMDATLFSLKAARADKNPAAGKSDLPHRHQSGDGLQKACEQFESLLLNMMIREMRATVPESTLLPGTMAEEIFSGMRDERIADEMAKNGGVGISRMLFNQLSSRK